MTINEKLVKLYYYKLKKRYGYHISTIKKLFVNDLSIFVILYMILVELTYLSLLPRLRNAFQLNAWWHKMCWQSWLQLDV